MGDLAQAIKRLETALGDLKSVSSERWEKFEQIVEDDCRGWIAEHLDLVSDAVHDTFVSVRFEGKEQQ